METQRLDEGQNNLENAHSEFQRAFGGDRIKMIPTDNGVNAIALDGDPDCILAYDDFGSSSIITPGGKKALELAEEIGADMVTVELLKDHMTAENNISKQIEDYRDGAIDVVDSERI